MVWFFSPKLQEKTQITSEDVCQEIQEIDEQYDVCSFSAHWSDIAFFQNVWEHGEYCHPGLANVSQTLANEAGYNFRLLDTFSCLDNAVYSHYLVAKGKFWKQWYHIVKTYLEMITKDDALFEFKTLHAGEPVSMHAFIVERVPSLILQDQSFKVKVSNKVTSNRGTFLDGVFNSASVYGQYAIKSFRATHGCGWRQAFIQRHRRQKILRSVLALASFGTTHVGVPQPDRVCSALHQ